MRARAPQSALGWTIYFVVLAAISLLLLLKAPDLAERLKPALIVMWLGAAVFFALWAIDRRRTRLRDQGSGRGKGK